MSDNEKQDLIELLNSNAIIGNNYDLKVVGNKIQAIPIVKDNNGNIVENMPTAYRQDALNLMKQGFLNGQDYTLSKNNDGTFEMDMQSSAAKNYEFDQKVVTYSKDGKTKTTMTTTGNSVETVITNNGQLVSQTTENREDALCMSLVEGRFNDANKLLGDNDFNGNDFNVYEACDKYQNLTGKNLIQELIQLHKDGKIDKYFLAKIVPSAINTNPNVIIVSKDYVDYELVQLKYDKNMQAYKMLKSYKPQETQIADLLYSNTSNEVKSETEYHKKVGSNNYVVKKENNNIVVSCNGDTHTINLDGIPSEVQKAIFELNPMALYRIASTGIKITIADRAFDKERGNYNAETNTIEINVGNLSYTTIQQTLLHEVGHSYYTVVRQQKNELLEEIFEEEYEAWKENNHKNTGDGGDYCTEDIYEFVAEAYALLVSEHSGSEYTICEYFPKTLAIVRQMIDNA